MINHESLKDGKQLLLFLLLSCFYSAQKITIDNKSDFPVEVEYSYKKFEIGIHQMKTINEKNGIKNISILYKNEKNLKRNIYVFLNPQESLNINLRKDTIKFKGDKEILHDYVYRGIEADLIFKIAEYQNYYQKNDAKGFIRTSEMSLSNVLSKILRLNNSPLGREDIHYKEIEELAKERWFFTVFVSFNGNQLNNTGKELMPYYFEKYFKKDITTYSCESWYHYDIIRKYSQNMKLLNLKLPKYEIVEHSDDDEVNQHLPTKCQEEYFRGSYNFWVHKKDLVRAEKYKKILTEKFHTKL
ncbi:hypothetical protein QFZ37_000479 [Chryseobacterium ginsenosidimutans]|uniref:hypothetical protein n=1 Tax=Chryseobacterium ginsenosidimutans TaxID=687846 RepID=UPI002789BD85|nr:hypothetical protein [Chryseobacterium ginsenosidimutans]MDQ0592110.1 hypothetical protein [Chryseobacterium ginsenosidimutans]